MVTMELRTLWTLCLQLIFFNFTAAQIVSNCPFGSGSSAICYSVNVPTTSASSGSGDIFFQLKGPTDRSWIALGQGTGMTGSNIFVMYPDSSGNNVTLSPRTGTGHDMPDFNSAAQVSLLSGSGISNGIMTANVKCSNCNSWSGGQMSFTDSSSNWIWASASGSGVDSDSTSANIDQHDEQGTINFDLTKATSQTASTSNPFVSTPGSPAASGSPSSPTGNPGNVGSSGSSSSLGNVNFAVLGMVRTAHASLMSIAFLFFFPLAAILIRVASFRGAIWIHAAIQTLSYALAIAGMGMGIWMAQNLSLLNAYHAIIGLVAVCVLILQFPLGLLHHHLYKSHGGRTTSSYLHMWLGRAALTLGAINGAFGLTLAGDSRSGLIAYGTLAGVIYVGYYLIIVITTGRKGSGARREQENGLGMARNKPPVESSNSSR